MNQVIIGSGNGLLPVLCHPLPQPMMIPCLSFKKMHKFQNGVYKMADIFVHASMFPSFRNGYNLAPLLLLWTEFNPIIDMESHAQ